MKVVYEDTPLLNSTHGASVQNMLDGPYAIPPVHLGDSEHALLLADGSSIIFTPGIFNDILGRIIQRGRGEAREESS
jgi:hypothetical protein